MGTGFALLAVGLLMSAAWRDIGTRTIPDTISAALLLTGTASRLHHGLAAAGASLLVAMLLFVGLALLHARGWLGGGDVKLAAGLAAGLPPHLVPLFLVATGIAGGVLAGAHLALRRWPLSPGRPRSAGTLRRVWRAERWRIARHGPLPYGVALACGGAWTLLLGSWG